MNWRTNPTVYEINTRIWLKEISNKYNINMDIADLPEEEISNIKEMGFDSIWLMGVWEPSLAGREIAATHNGLLSEFKKTLNDLKSEDIVSSPYAVKSYNVSKILGGNESLIKFREKINKIGLKLILDFVPNHTAIDHPWIKEHPEYYVKGTYSDYIKDSANFFNAGSESEPQIFAHGKDPYYPGWTDTAQLNYFNTGLRKAMIEVIKKIATMSDGIRCDMAMLIMKGIQYQVWGDKLFTEKDSKSEYDEFWSEAIKEVKKEYPNFIFIAEAYWMKEGPLQELGFDYTYDKALYDWLKRGEVREISSYINKGFDEYQKKCIRFIENHDEERAGKVFGTEHQKSALLTILSLPGASLIHEGEIEGKKIKVPVQLSRRPEEPINKDIQNYYLNLLKIISEEEFHGGKYRLYHQRSAWEGNYTYTNYLIWSWSSEKNFYLVVINFSPFRSQCYVTLPSEEVDNQNCTLVDLIGPNIYERDGCVLCRQGLYLDLQPWTRHLFKFEREEQ